MTPSHRGSAVFAAPLLALVALTISACASGGPREKEKTLDERRAECETRGGFLTPTGQSTGRDALDYVCRITGGPSERVRGS